MARRWSFPTGKIEASACGEVGLVALAYVVSAVLAFAFPPLLALSWEVYPKFFCCCVLLCCLHDAVAAKNIPCACPRGNLLSLKCFAFLAERGQHALEQGHVLVLNATVVATEVISPRAWAALEYSKP